MGDLFCDTCGAELSDADRDRTGEFHADPDTHRPVCYVCSTFYSSPQLNSQRAFDMDTKWKREACEE